MLSLFLLGTFWWDLSDNQVQYYEKLNLVLQKVRAALLLNIGKITKDENFCGNVKHIILNHKNIIFITDVMTFIDTIYSS